MPDSPRESQKHHLSKFRPHGLGQQELRCFCSRITVTLGRIQRRKSTILICLDNAAEILPRPQPIEQVFAKFKTLLRKAGARTYEAISDTCGKILAQYPPAECAAYLKNAGYP